jgi:two-component system sensor histidine kinase UhpB
MSAPFFQLGRPWQRWSQRWSLSTFEKVIVANSVIILLETGAGWWIIQHNPETYHYLIDTLFIALAAFLGMMVNFLVLRAAFAPLHGLLGTIKAIEAGDLDARAVAEEHDADVLALARTFNAMLHRLALARHEAAGRVLQAQEEERRRLALELHDQIGQSLTALTFHAQAIAQRLVGESSGTAAQARRQAEQLTELAQRTLAEVQALSRQLRPPLLDDLGLCAALRWLAEDVSERFAVRVKVHLHEESGALAGDAARLPGEVETALFRIAQESLTNAIRHGQARQVEIALRQEQNVVTLTVADDGAGFAAQPLETSGSRQGVGLEGMHERAQLLGGTLRVRSRPGEGCVICARVPLSPVEAFAC